MRESIANSAIFSIILTVIAVSSALVLFSLSYSKTFKIKNKVIDMIESNGGYDTNLQGEIDNYLRSAGYNSFKSGSCSDNIDGATLVSDLSKQAYMYCVYEFTTAKGVYYTVKVYMNYNLPIISEFINIRYSIRGDSSIIFKFND